MATKNSFTIAALRERIARGELSHEALVEQVLEAAAQPAAEHVFTRLYADAARAAARHADAARKAGVALGPLAGLPVSVKDLYDVAGETTMAGSAVCAGEPPAARDAVAVARLRAQGAAIVGKTNMTEFAFSGVGINPHYGTPRNPADTDTARIPGGSSSGAAVSVALGLAVAGLGSDTGGSIRIPAALCGLVGFKSTQSRVPRTGAFELARSLDTVCAMARSVEDCLIADAAIADTPLAVRRRPLQGMRLAVPRTLMFDDIEPAVAQAFDRALQALSVAGAQIVDITLAELAEIATVNAPGGFSPVEASAVHRERFAAKRDGFDSRVAARIALGTDVRPGGVEVTVQAPFGRGFALATDCPRQGHVRDVSGCERGVRHAGGRDVETVVGTQADVAGGPPVEPGRLHGQGGSDELLARVSHRPPRRGTGTASLRGWPGSCRVR